MKTRTMNYALPFTNTEKPTDQKAKNHLPLLNVKVKDHKEEDPHQTKKEQEKDLQEMKKVPEKPHQVKKVQETDNNQKEKKVIDPNAEKEKIDLKEEKEKIDQKVEMERDQKVEMEKDQKVKMEKDPKVKMERDQKDQKVKKVKDLKVKMEKDQKVDLHLMYSHKSETSSEDYENQHCMKHYETNISLT